MWKAKGRSAPAGQSGYRSEKVIMAYSYCTLFDKNYLDKGLVLIESLRKYNTDSNIYVLAMDEKCYEILNAVNTYKVILVHLSDFETPELRDAKKNRSRGEYCWTCAAHFIYYVLMKNKEEYCTYLDADMYFYDNPNKLVDEMVNAGKSVQIIEHRFRNGFAGKMQESLSGKYCVEFNTFKNNDAGKKVLITWKNQTIQQCEMSGSAEHFGDQMYLNDWMDKYDCVNILQDIGAGLAPWNINRYKLLKEVNGEIWTLYDNGNNPVRVVFYHFHDLKYVSRNKVNIGVHKRYWKLNMELTYKLYGDYLKKIKGKKEWLEKEYGLYPFIQGNAVGKEENLGLWGRIKRLFAGNAYKNIRFRIGNYLKIFLFQKYDIINID